MALTNSGKRIQETGKTLFFQIIHNVIELERIWKTTLPLSITIVRYLFEQASNLQKTIVDDFWSQHILNLKEIKSQSNAGESDAHCSFDWPMATHQSRPVVEKEPICSPINYPNYAWKAIINPKSRCKYRNIKEKWLIAHASLKETGSNGARCKTMDSHLKKGDLRLKRETL